MKTSIDLVRAKYPQLRYCYSITSEYDTLATEDVSFMDLLEPHIWMAQASDFYDRVGYHYERFSMTGYENLVASAEQLYRSNPAHWIGCLEQQIQQIAKWSIASQKPLVTTECWGVVDYKDWPLLKWDWVKELCEAGVRSAAGTGRWMAMATSNFCGPQFVGMWRDVAWHRALTDLIHQSPLPK